MRRRLISTIVACLAWAGLALPAAAEPPIWVVKDKDSTIYLFGTIHMLPKGTEWRTPKIDKALNESSELYLEIADVTSFVAQGVAAILMLRFGLSPSKPLSSRLTAEQYKDLDKAAQAAGFDAQSLNPMRPWLAAMMIQTGQMMQSGMEQEPGVDVQLQKQFSKRRAPVKGLETLSQQIKVFSDLPEEEEIAFLIDTVESSDVGSDSFEDLVDSWRSGDTRSLEKAIVVDMKSESGVLYRELIAERNADWANQIEKLLAGSGVTFIAVGAGHLVGPDSVQALLKAKGIESSKH
jgi:uncharacterized protein YbaP (TraB family)